MGNAEKLRKKIMSAGVYEEDGWKETAGVR